MEIVRGSERHYGVELRLTTSELDIIVAGLKKLEKTKRGGIDSEQLLKEMEIMAELPRIRALRKYGSFGDSRLNFD